MIDQDAVRSAFKRKLIRSIDATELLLLSKNSYTVYDAHDISETTIRKLKLQLELNSILLEEAKDNGEKKKLKEERKELQDDLAMELEEGLDILNAVSTSLRLGGREDLAREFEILRDVRESELNELKESS
jgi:hypothetical protein